MRYYDRADSVEVFESEEGFRLSVQTAEGDSFVFHIHHIAEEFAKNVNSTIGTWLWEAQNAQSSGPLRIAEEGYNPSDPKHPDWHSVHSDLYDQEKETA